MELHRAWHNVLSQFLIDCNNRHDVFIFDAASSCIYSRVDIKVTGDSNSMNTRRFSAPFREGERDLHIRIDSTP